MKRIAVAAASLLVGCVTTTPAHKARTDEFVAQVGQWHPEVPVTGAVKTVSKDGKFTLELLDYGWTGAKSALP